MTLAKSALGSAVFALVLTGLPHLVLAAPCDMDGAGAAEVAAARALTQSACGCPSDDSYRSWRSCVRDALRTAVNVGDVSRTCARKARRAETGSTCGRPDRVVCCRTNAARWTRATVRAEDRCRAPRGGSACVSPSPYKEDACTTIGCVAAPVCGDGFLDEGEACDPPDGSTCDENCQPISCAAQGPGTLLACHQGTAALRLAGIDEVFLAAFSGGSPDGNYLAQIQRFDAASDLLDPEPIPISFDPSDGANASFGVSSATEGEASFHVAMSGGQQREDGGYLSVFRRREIPALGPLTSEPIQITSNFPIGICTTWIQGPIGIAAGLGNGEVRTSFRNLFVCEGTVLFETLAGVPGGFSTPPPGNTSEGSAPLARGASNIAGVWWNRLTTNLSPLVSAKSLRLGWLEPGPQTLVDLLAIPPNLAHSRSPALAASGDVFLAVFATPPNLAETELTTLRALRFSREAGVLGPPNGLVLTAGGGPLDQVVVDGDADGFQVAYTEEQPGGALRVRTLRVETDGSFTAPEEIDTATVSTIDVVTTSAATFLGYTTASESGHVAVRVIRLDP